MDILEQLRKCSYMHGPEENHLEPYHSAANEIESLRNDMDELKDRLILIRGRVQDLVNDSMYILEDDDGWRNE